MIPTLDRILIKRIEAPKKTAGGVYLPEKMQQKSNIGEVVAVGPGRRNNEGTHVPVSFSVKDKVLLPESYLSNDVKINGEDFILLREDDILGVVQE